MALSSAGVQVTVIDESFYTSAAPGTTPIIFVATKANKTKPASSDIAPGTLAANVGKVWTITSQRDLVDTFGSPLFYTDTNSNPVHGGELNEYGLQAAYSMMAISSRAYVVRSDVDLNQLIQTSSEPKGSPTAGTLWVDTASSTFGVSEWDHENGVFVNKTAIVIDDSNDMTTADINGAPKASFGKVGDYAVYVTMDNQFAYYFKNDNNIWVKIGTNVETSFGNPIVDYTFTSHCWQTSHPVTKGKVGLPQPAMRFTINGISITLTDVSYEGIAGAINALAPQAGIGAKTDGVYLYLYADATAQSNGGQAPDGRIILADGVVGTLAALGLTAGTYGPISLAIAPHTQFPQFKTSGAATGSVYIKTTSPNGGSSWIVKYYNGATNTWQTISAPVYANSQSAISALDKSGGTSLTAGKLFVQSNYNEGANQTSAAPILAEFKLYRRASSSPTTIATTLGVGAGWSAGQSFTMAESLAGQSTLSSPKTITITTSTVDGFVSAVSAAGLKNVSANYDYTTRVLKISHALGGEMHFTDGLGEPLYNAGFYDLGTDSYATNLYPTGLFSPYDYVASNWKPVNLLTSDVAMQKSAPHTEPAEGTLWYSAIQDEVDIMVHNGTTWVGYRVYFPDTSPAGPIIKATSPDKDTGQSDGSPLVAGDIWIDSSDPELYGKNVYVWNADTLKWIKQDLSDNTSPSGWLFADARWTINGVDEMEASIEDLLVNSFLDPDAPDPTQYPQGMRLWNLRRSGNNVKRYAVSEIDITANDGKNIRFNDEIMDGSTGGTKYRAARWVSAAGNNEDGSGKFGRHAQRGFVVKSLKSLIDTNQAVRDTDTMVANLIACPGYTEVVANMVGLNIARGQTAFVIGDTPMRLASNGTALREWGASTTALDNGDDGAVSYDEYLAFFYPSGYTTDNSGNNIVVPPSHMVLRTIAASDQVSYPWFAPAGTRRGGISNATAVGYLKNGEFQQSPLPQNLRDVLQDVKINPIATLPGQGIVLFGQKTRARNASALDRINVSRLVAYLRRQLDLLARPFLFEPNDRTTRNEIKAAAESLLLELVSQRALYDFVVQCDEQNNTPARIDRNELHVDIAIEPVKAVEFIFIPLRLKNTGEIAAGN